MVKERATAYRIQDIATDDRPRERLEEHGAQTLRDAELLAILLRVGIEGENAVDMGQRLLTTFGDLYGLQRATFAELCAQKGLGRAKAAQIKAAIEIGKRIKEVKMDERPVIHSPEDAARLVQYEMAALTQEHLRVILLDTRNRVLRTETVYIGSLNSSTVRVGELFKAAIHHSAAGVIIVHNHPSGDPTPSPEDVNLTRMAVQAGKLMDVEVLDHVVIGRGRHVSLKERGLGFS